MKKKLIMTTFLTCTGCFSFLQQISADSVMKDSTVVASAAAKRGETASANTKRSVQVKKEEAPIPFKNRLAFSTNAVSWALMLPNIRMEVALSNPTYKPCYTLSLQAQWNGSTDVKSDRTFQYRINDYRMEIRRYTRPSTVLPVSKSDDEQNLKKKQRVPKFWRAYYVGLYAEYGEYNVIMKRGAAGSLISAGFTGGWQIPLYAGRNGSGIDLDLGLSVGAAALKFDKYHQVNDLTTMDESYTKYKEYKLLPYPVVTEIRVGFVYRFNSVRNQFKRMHFKAN